MSKNEQLAKILEFLHRTQILNKAEQHYSLDDPTVYVSEALLVLADYCHWNVDDAVQAFQDAIGDPDGNEYYPEFNKKEFLKMLADRTTDIYDNVEDLNKRVFELDLSNPTPTEKPEEPSM